MGKSIMLALLAVGLVVPGHAETLRDADGRRVGTITQEGNRQVLRGSNGAAKSYWQQEGSTIVHRDMNSKRLDTISR